MSAESRGLLVSWTCSNHLPSRSRARADLKFPRGEPGKHALQDVNILELGRDYRHPVGFKTRLEESYCLSFSLPLQGRTSKYTRPGRR
jgi:hypothetical protein